MSSRSGEASCELLYSVYLYLYLETDHTNRPSFSLLTLVTFHRLEVLPFPPVRLTVNGWLLINLTSVKSTGAKADFLPTFSSNMPLTFRFHRTVGVSYRFGNIHHLALIFPERCSNHSLFVNLSSPYHRCKKNVFNAFCHVFNVFNVFSKRFYLKNVGKVQSGKQINKKHFQNNSNEIDL